MLFRRRSIDSGDEADNENTTTSEEELERRTSRTTALIATVDPSMQNLLSPSITVESTPQEVFDRQNNATLSEHLFTCPAIRRRRKSRHHTPRTIRISTTSSRKDTPNF